MFIAISKRVVPCNTKEVEANSESVFEARGNKHVIFEVSGAAPDKKKLKAEQPFKIDETRYHSLKKLLRVTAYVNLFINHIRNKQETDKELTSSEIN